MKNIMSFIIKASVSWKDINSVPLLQCGRKSIAYSFLYAVPPIKAKKKKKCTMSNFALLN